MPAQKIDTETEADAIAETMRPSLESATPMKSKQCVEIMILDPDQC